MAPSKINDDLADHIPIKQGMPSMYLLDPYAPEVLKHCRTIFRTVTFDDPEIHNWRENADAVLARESQITAEDISLVRRLRACGKQGVGLDNIDIDACKKHGIAVLNTPGMNAQAVAEHVLALTLSVAREVGRISTKLAQGHTVTRFECLGKTLHGKTVGIVGMGAIGSTVASIFQTALGCQIVAYDPFAPAGAWSSMKHTRVATLEEILPQVDVLTLHLPLTHGTRGLISYPQLKEMKPSAILINAARGGIVDEEDLTRALEEGLIWGAGLDCHVEEPPTNSRYERLWSTGKVVSTPHVGATVEGLQVQMGIGVIDNIYAALKAAQQNGQ